jgi:alkyl hydroperoxide reductase subunit AhpF
MPASEQTGNPATITVVRAEACHLCDDAQDALADAAQHGNIRVEVVEADSAAGTDLVSRHRPATFPLILINGEFFSQGRLPRGKLRALLAARREMSPR